MVGTLVALQHVVQYQVHAIYVCVHVLLVWFCVLYMYNYSSFV